MAKVEADVINACLEKVREETKQKGRWSAYRASECTGTDEHGFKTYETTDRWSVTVDPNCTMRGDEVVHLLKQLGHDVRPRA
jgi:hypothetical protein